MSTYAGIKIRHTPVRTYSNAQTGFVGAQNVINRRGVLPTFTDSNCYFISDSTGKDSNAGTYAAPKKSIHSLFDTTIDLLTDSSGNSRSLTAAGAVPFRYKDDYPKPRHGNYTVGPFTDSIYFSAPAGLLGAMAGLASFSIEAYIFIDPTMTAGKNFLFCTPASATIMYCYLDTTLNPVFTYKSSTITGPALTARKWYHIAFVVSGTNQYIYIDNKIVASSASSGGAITTIASLRIGMNQTAGGEYFRGLVNRIIFKNTATASFPTPIAEAGILARYEFQTDPLFHNKTYACVLDSNTYYETIDNSNFSDNYAAPLKIYAADGQAPVLQPWRGAIPGTYGASATRYSYTLPADSVCAFVSKAGNDSTGALGNRAKPYLTITAASSALGGTHYAVVILDSGIYVENVIDNSGQMIALYADKSLLANPVLMPADNLINLPYATCHFREDNLPAILSFYGVTLNGRTNGATATCALSNGLATTFKFYDCSIMGYADIHQNLGATSYVDCEFENCYIDTVYQTTNTVTVAFFGQNNFYTQHDQATCTFRMYALSRNWTFSNATLAVTMVTPNPSGGGGHIWVGISEAYLFNSLFTNCTGDISGYASVWHAIGDTTFSGCSLSFEKAMTTAATTFFRFNNCLADSATGNGFNFACASNVNNTIYNCTATNCGGAGFYLKYATLVWTYHPEVLDAIWRGTHPDEAVKYLVPYGLRYQPLSVLDVNSNRFYQPFSWDYVSAVDSAHYISHCSAVGNAGYGFDGLASVVASNLYASGNTTGPWAMSGAFTPTNSTYDNTVVDGRYLAVAPTSLAIQDPTSSYPAFYGAETFGVILKGTTKTGYSVSTPGAAESCLDGFVIAIAQNQCTGISASWGCTVKYCSIRGGALYGIKTFLAEAYACDVNAYGFGVQMLGERSYTNRCVFHGCTSAGILDMSINGRSDHNTMTENYIGYWSTPGNSIGFIQDNIAVNNGIGDISTLKQVGTTCYASANGYLTPYTGVATDGGNIQLDPLFWDIDGQDYRLQAVAWGFPFDSPAKGTSSTSTDMGAFSVTYGALVEAWTTIDLGTATWRNPDHVDTVIEAVKSYEGRREDGSAYSGAVAYRRRWEFTWDTDQNDMPEAQAVALLGAYQSATSECQVDFGDGRGWVTCTLLRSTEFSRTNMGGIGWASTETPRPVNAMTFIETGA